MKQFFLSAVLVTVITLLALEAGTAVGIRTGLISVKPPSYSLDQVRARPFWRDMNPAFGVWHEPNRTYRHRSNCFDVRYRANAYGARDPERTVQSERPRVVVLGDSFVEGFGVNESERMTTLLERDTGIEHLNFGIAGTGNTQHFL